MPPAARGEAQDSRRVPRVRASSLLRNAMTLCSPLTFDQCRRPAEKWQEMAVFQEGHGLEIQCMCLVLQDLHGIARNSDAGRLHTCPADNDPTIRQWERHPYP